MNTNFNQLAILQQLKSGMDRFRAGHPKFPMFLKAVSQDALVEGSVIEISVTTPEGKSYCSNVKLNADDMEFIKTLRSMDTH